MFFSVFVILYFGGLAPQLSRPGECLLKLNLNHKCTGSLPALAARSFFRAFFGLRKEFYSREGNTKRERKRLGPEGKHPVNGQICCVASPMKMTKQTVNFFTFFSFFFWHCIARGFDDAHTFSSPLFKSRN